MHKKVVIGAMALCLTASGAGAAIAASGGPPPKHAKIDAVQKVQFKINRYVKDALRWQKDVYQVKSGGTITITNKANDGPHTFSVVNKKDLPRTTKQINNCKICQTIAQEHGADPNSDAPPTHLFVEDGTGQDTPPSVDKPGDSAFVGPGPGDNVTLTVTAKKGTTLYFMCAIHPWMQAKLQVK
jgi:plastocyanin